MKKVLFISYYWPPSGKATLQWPLKIIKHLPMNGWEPLVLTVTEDTFSESDETFLNDIDPGLKVFRAKSIEPFNIYKIVTGRSKDSQLVSSETISKTDKSLTHKLSLWLRMNLFIPDARVGWYFPAVKEGIKILSEENVDAVVSVGPPHSLHMIGKKLSRKFNLPHIPVFIDPWVDIIYYKDFNRSMLTLKIDNHLERSVLKNCTAVIFVTNTINKDYEKKYPFINKKSHVLYWGYSEEDFDGIEIKQKISDEKIIVHAGNLFSYQNPVNFWKQVKKEIDNGTRLKLKFIGTVDPAIKLSINNSGLSNYTEYLGFLPYNKMIEAICNADYLLVCATEPRHVPGKLFEYLRTGKPIIAFGDGNEEVKNILVEANAGMMFGYQESGNKFLSKVNTFSTNQNYSRRFERKLISKELTDLLNSISIK